MKFHNNNKKKINNIDKAHRKNFVINMLSDFEVDPSDFADYKEDTYNDSYGAISLVHPKGKPYETIALKRVTISDKRSQLTHFMRKITSMAQINHPCVIRLKGFSMVSPSKNVSEELNIYLSYLPNGNLNKVVREDFKHEEKVLTPTIKTKIIYGIASGMSFLHKINIIHRDLKPENILLDEKFNPVIIDLGLARVFDENNMTFQLGSPCHMAPELFYPSNDVHLTMKIDVYAFAVTLLRLFTDSLRFKSKKVRNYKDLAEAIMGGLRYVIPEEVPEFYASLIQRCWDDNPEKRPSFEEIVNEFEYNDDFMLDGSDAEEVRKFIDDIKQNSSENSPNPSDRDDHEDHDREFDFF